MSLQWGTSSHTWEEEGFIFITVGQDIPALFKEFVREMSRFQFTQTLYQLLCCSLWITLQFPDISIISPSPLQNGAVSLWELSHCLSTIQDSKAGKLSELIMSALWLKYLRNLIPYLALSPLQRAAGGNPQSSPNWSSSQGFLSPQLSAVNAAVFVSWLWMVPLERW